MNQRDRIRRAAILCCHCVRNSAYHRAGIETKDDWIDEDFWRNIYSNFIDIALTEWCKLFADKSGKHRWARVVSNKDTFLADLYDDLKIAEDEFESYIEKLRQYRDKFLSHLDEEETMHIPNLEIAIRSTIFLYNLLIKENPEHFNEPPYDLNKFYKQKLQYAKTMYLGALQHNN